MNHLQETQVNIISEGTTIRGDLVFDQISRIHGVLMGQIKSKPGSTLVLCESCKIEGNIEADTLMIDGYVRGDIKTTSRVVISKTGRVIGNIETPSLVLEFGAHFEGECSMGSSTSRKVTATSIPVPTST